MADYSLISKVKNSNNDSILKNRTQGVINRHTILANNGNESRSVTLQDATEYNEYRFRNDFTNSLSAINNKYNYIKELYGQFYTNGITYDKDGNPVQGADATSYADRYEFAEFLHELYPELSVEYFMKNAEDFIYRATGVKADISTYSNHIGNVLNASWANAGNSILTVMDYLGAAFGGKFGTKDWENTKAERAKKTALSGANYRKDLGDEKYDSLIQKMWSGTMEQSPQMAMVAGMMLVSLATGGISGAGGIGGLLALKNLASASKFQKITRAVGTGFNFLFSGLMDAGNFMSELSSLGVSDEAAFAAGLTILATTGFLETWGDDTILKPVDKVANSLFRLKDKKVVSQAAKSTLKIIADTGLRFAKEVGKSEITETVQEEAEYLAEVFAKELVYNYEKAHGNTLDREDLGLTHDQIIDSMKETAKQTLLSTPFMTLGSNVVSTGLDAVFGTTAQQWTPSKYMNKKGATNIRSNSTIVTNSIHVDESIKDGDNGKINPIKGYSVGNYFFVDGPVSAKQADYLLGGKRSIYTIETSESKVTDASISTLKSSAIDSETTMTAEQADSYLASLEVEKKLKSYGYDENNKVSGINYGEATSLYVTLKDTGETIKIDIGKDNSGKLSELKNLTGVEYKKFEEEDFVKPEDIESLKKETKKKKKESAAKESTQETQTEEEAEAGPSVPEDFDVAAEAGDETVPNDKEYLESLKNKVAPENVRKETTSKDFDAKKKAKQGYRAHTHEYLTANGDLANNRDEARTVKLTDENGVQYVRIDNLNNENIDNIVKLSYDYGQNPLDVQRKTKFAKDTVAKKNEAMKTAGIEKSSTEPVQRVKDKQIATKSNDSSTQQNTTDQTAKSTSQATVSKEQAQTTGATTKATGTQQTQGTSVETTTGKAQTSSEDTTGTTAQPEAVTTEQAETTDEKTEEKAADTKKETVTEKELDEATDTLQKERGVERESARGLALLAKGLKDLFKALGHEIDYKKAVSHLNVSTLANTKTLKDRISVFLDLIVDHPYGKELFKEVYGDKRMTKKARAEFKEEITNVLYGRKSNMDESAYTKLEKLIKPTLAAVINQSELTAEEQKLAEDLKKKEETADKEEDVKKKAQKEEAKLTKEEKKQEKQKSKEDKEIEARNERQNKLKNSAYWLARGAYEYYKNQALFSKNNESRNERFNKTAEIYKDWANKLVKGDFNTALQFISTLEARQAESLVKSHGDFSFYPDPNNKDKPRYLRHSVLKYGELEESAVQNEETTEQPPLKTKEEKKAEAKKAARELALKDSLEASLKYYAENRQVRTVAEMQALPVTLYQLNKLNIALNRKLAERIDYVVDDVIFGIPNWTRTKFIYDKDGNEVLNENGTPQTEQISSTEADIEYVANLFNYLNGIISSADSDIAQTIENKTQDVNLTDPDTREQKAKEAVDELRPLFAYSLAVNIEQNLGSFTDFMQQIQDGKFEVQKIQDILSKAEDDHEWMYNTYFRDSILNINMQDYLARQNGLTPEVKEAAEPEKLKTQMIGEKGADNLNDKYPIFMENHRKAVELRKQGIPIEEIWNQTGWYWGVDGKWRMEIPDTFSEDLLACYSSDVSLFKQNTRYFRSGYTSTNQIIEEDFESTYNGKHLPDFIGKDNKLLKAYPDLKNFEVKFYFLPNNRIAGSFQPLDNTIIINFALVDTAKKLKTTLVHEIQHAVQLQEGFAVGGNGDVALELAEKEFSQQKEMLSDINGEIWRFNTLDVLLSNVKDEFSAGRQESLNISLNDFMNADIATFPSAVQKNFIGYFDLLMKTDLLNKPVNELTQGDIHEIENAEKLAKDKMKSFAIEGYSVNDALKLFGIDEDEFWSGTYDEIGTGNTYPIYQRIAGEVEARNAADRWKNNLYSEFPLSTQDKRTASQFVIDEDGNLINDTKDEQTLRYQDGKSLPHIESREVDTSRYASSFMFDTTKGQYYIDAKNAYNELVEVLSAAQGENPNMAEIRKNAQLGAIFLSSLSDDLQDAFVRKSITANRANLQASLTADSNESLFRLFFTTAESAQTVDDKTRGATLSQSAKILLSPYANASTLKHEPIHIIWNLDPSIRERAKVEYKAYFEKDPDGGQIRAVVKKDPDRFGNYTADDIVRGLKRLTEDDFDYLKETDPEEALAYMFEAYDEKRDIVEYSDGIKGIMERIAKFLHTVADKMQKFFGIDILHETNNKIFSPIFADQSEYEKFSEQAATQDMDLAQFDRPQARTLAMSDNGNIRVMEVNDDILMTHCLTWSHFETALERGGKLPVISLAVGTAPHIPLYGWGYGYGEAQSQDAVIFFGGKKLAERYMQDGYLKDRDQGTGFYPTVKHFSPGDDTHVLLTKVSSYSNGDYLCRFLSPLLSTLHDFLEDNIRYFKSIYNLDDYGFPTIGIRKTDDLEFEEDLLSQQIYKQYNDDSSSYNKLAIVTQFVEYLESILGYFDFSKIAEGSAPFIKGEETNASIDAICSYFKENEDAEIIFSIFNEKIKKSNKEIDIPLDFDEWRNNPKVLFHGEPIPEGDYIIGPDRMILKDEKGNYLIDNVENIASILIERNKREKPLPGVEIWQLKNLISRSRYIRNLEQAKKYLRNESPNYIGVHNPNNKRNKRAFAESFDQLNEDLIDIHDSVEFTIPDRFYELYSTDWSLIVRTYEIDGGLEDVIANWIYENGYNGEFDLEDLRKRLNDGFNIEVSNSKGESFIVKYTAPSENNINRIIDDIIDLFDARAAIDIDYGEVKPLEITNFSDLSAIGLRVADDAKFEKYKSILEKEYGLTVARVRSTDSSEVHGEIAAITDSVAGKAEQLKFQTIGSALNEIRNDSKSGEEKKQKMTQYEELVYKYVTNPAVDTLKTVETWRKENNGFFADKDSIRVLRSRLESGGLFHNVDIQTELTAEMKDEIKESVTKRIAYSTEDYMAWGKKLGTIGEKIHDKDQNSVFVKEALYDLFGYKEVTINGKKVIKPTGLISKILSNVKRSATTDWAQPLIDSIAARRDQMMKNGELVITDYETAHNTKPLTGETLHKFFDKSNWTASDTKKSRNTLKGNKGYDSLVFDINSMDISVADIENFIRVLTTKDGNTYLPFVAQESVANFGSALEGPLVTLVNYAHVSDDINKNKFQADSLYNTDEDFLRAAYNNAKKSKKLTIDSSIYLIDKSERDLISAIMTLKKDGLLTGIYGLDVTAEEFKRNLLGSIDDLVEDAEKRKQQIDTLKASVVADSYDAVSELIGKANNLLQREQRIIRKIVGPSGLSEAEVRKLQKQVEDLQAEKDQLKKDFDSAVQKGIEETDNKELIKLKNELATKDITIDDLLKKNKELKNQAKNAVNNFFSKKFHLTSEQLENMGDDTSKFLEAYSKEIDELQKKINGYQLTNANLNSKITQLEERIKKGLNIANSLKDDFAKAGVLPLFDNTVKNIENLINKNATKNVQQRLSILMAAIGKPIKGDDHRFLDFTKALYFDDIFKAGNAINENADNYLDYRDDARALRIWVWKNMCHESETKNVPFVAKTIDQLSAGELIELNDLIKKVVMDSRKYYKESNEAEIEYHKNWRKNISKEIQSYAKASGVNLLELTMADSIGTDDSKSSGFKSFLRGLIEDFRIQSAKYRYNYPTLYAYLFGGVDHEGEVWQGLNGAQNELINQVQKRTSEMYELIINEFSESKFYKGKLTEKNLQRNMNAVKSSYKQTLTEEEFTNEDRQKTGLKIEPYQKGRHIEYAISIDEDNESAMREVARWYGEIEKRRRELQDKINKYNEEYDSAENDYNTAALALTNLETSDLDVADELLNKAEDAEKKTKKRFERIKEGLEKAQKELELLEIKGSRPNENMNKYTTQELLGIYLIAKQKGGIERLIYAPRLFTDENGGIAGSSVTNNLSIGNVISVIKMIEEDEDYAPLKHMAGKISDIVSERFEEVRDTRFFISKGTDYIESVDDYFGFFVEEGDFDYGQDLDTDLGIAKAEGTVSTNAKASDSMTKKRRGEAGLNLRAFDTAKNQIYRQEYYIAFGKQIENIKDLITDDEFVANLKIAEGREAGREDLKQLRKFTNALASSQKTISEDYLSDGARFLTNSTAASAMMFRASTILVQLPTLLVSMKDKHIGIKGVLKGMVRAFKDNSIDDLSPQMRDRMNGYIKSIKETRNLGTIIGSHTLEKVINVTQSIGLKGLEIVDNYVAEAMWYAYYDGVQAEYREAGKDKGLTSEEFETLCANEATQRVMDITPVQQAKDNAYMYNNRNAVLRNLLLFTNQSTKMLNLAINGFDDVTHHKGNAVYIQRLFKTIGVMAMISILNGLIKGTLLRKTKDDDDDEAQIHLLSNIFSSLWEGVEDTIPISDILFPSSYSESTAFTDVGNLVKVILKDEDERTEHQLANACAYFIRDTMNVIGFPGAEAMAIYRGFIYGEPFNAGYLYNNTVGEFFGGGN